MALKVKLVSVPGLDPLIPRIIYLPYGIATISALLKQSNYEVEKEDLNVEMMKYSSPMYHLKNLRTVLRMRDSVQLSAHLFGEKFRPEFDQYIEEVLPMERYREFDVIGISVLSHEAMVFALMLVQRLKRQYPEKKVVLGGAYLSIVKDHSFDRLPYVDFIIHGRGEYPLLALMDYLSHGTGSVEAIDGLIYRDGRGTIHVNEALDSNLNEEPIPDYDGLDFDRYKGYLQPELGKEGYGFSIPYRTNLGCVRRCNFCDYQCVHGSYREKDVSKTVDEIAILFNRYRSPYFHIVDSALNNNPSKLREFCLKLIDRGLKVRWHGYMRATDVSRELLALMKKAGAFSLRWGIESGNSDVLKYIGKGYTGEQAMEALDTACELGFKNTILMIVGEPHERIEHVRDSIALLKRYVTNRNINYLVYRLKLISHSPLFQKPEKYKISNIHPIGDDDFNLITFTRPEYQFDETEGLSWKERTKLTDKLMNYLLREVHRVERTKGRSVPALRSWQKSLLEKSYFLRYLKTLVLSRPVRYVT